MSQWAEIRHQHLVEGVSKKQIARRLQLDIKTVRRAVEQPTPPVRASSPRVRSLDPWREQIAQWLDQDRRLRAKRMRGCYRSHAFNARCLTAGLRSLYTRPFTPRTNGKVERFIQTALREWAYAHANHTSAERTANLAPWLHRYNRHRPPPAARRPVAREDKGDATRGTGVRNNTKTHQINS